MMSRNIRKKGDFSVLHGTSGVFTLHKVYNEIYEIVQKQLIAALMEEFSYAG